LKLSKDDLRPTGFGYKTFKCGNLYAYIMERSLNILKENGRFGMIVPMSINCTQRMAYIQDEIKQYGFYMSNFSWRPSKLFDGSDKANLSLSIVITNNKNDIFTTTYNKWYSEQRGFLLNNISYIKNNNFKTNFIIPKINNNIEKEIYSKIYKLNSLESIVSKNKNNHSVYYRNTGGLYWKIFTDFQPEFFKNGIKDSSSRETQIYFNSENDKTIALSLFWSNFYWWWYVINSNGRDNNPYDLKSIPIVKNIFIDTKLLKLGKELISNIKNNAEFDNRQHGADITKFQKFNPSKSKYIIDKIDKVLAEHYGFTDEELDFIINYDIKYRMGNIE
jgi:hypothetical protein